jgi:predicted RND superfamily exporter protein
MTMKWHEALTHLTVRRTGRTLMVVGVVTAFSLVLAEHLELRMNWTDLLPEETPVVAGYRDILDRFGEASLVIALEGDRDAIVDMAEELEPRLQAMESLYNVAGKYPVAFLRNHAALLLKPEQFERSLRIYRDWTLPGTLRGINDDYEREYTSSESNLRRDEVEIARGLLGIARSLDLLSAAVGGETSPAALAEAVDAMVLGEPWLLSLDRRMLLITCVPVAHTADIDATIETVEEVEAVLAEVAARHPEVHASTTGMAKISQDEINSIGLYTQILSMIALVLIYLLLSQSLRGWVVPLIAIVALLVGIFWTMGTLQILFGSLNIFTVMIMLVLLGLGIDFSIHLIARFQEELGQGSGLEQAVGTMYSHSGVAVITGAVTTALAFLTLMVAETHGVFEFGVAAGLGTILTLISVFLVLPSLLAMRYRRIQSRRSVEGDETGSKATLAGEGYAWIGNMAALGWRRPGLFLTITLAVAGAAILGISRIDFEYDFLELEAKGLRSVELQRQIPQRFGISDHAAWAVAGSVEESRTLKESMKNLTEVGEVAAISDYLPSGQRLAAYRPQLESFRAGPLARDLRPWRQGDAAAVVTEIERLWDNLDLMSNLAFAAGLDRIVSVIDGMTGLDAESGLTDPGAPLPMLERRLAGDGAIRRLPLIAQAWAGRLRANLEFMTNPDSYGLEALPANVLRSFVPRTGDDFLVHIVPRKYLWDRQSQERFAGQTESVHPNVVGTEKLILVMMESTLQDGRAAALLALAVIAILLTLHMRGPVGLLALIPLSIGLLLMLGLMYVFDMKFNYMNLIATPIIIGIGIDDGVHALHRYREQRGQGARHVAESFRFVGKAILLTSLTTMIGFGSVAFYEMRGMANFGLVLFMGVGSCFLATVFVLPPVMRVFSRQPDRDSVPT